ncbi:MAG: ferrous iron transport protein B [Deltaproteobacteria bacterium]|nr:ferrous iron transport protein B [Deltaproteobacteria bacterium]
MNPASADAQEFESNARTEPMRIVLAGNPNCGKTTLFNALTGLRYKVANYPGVTVEKKEGRLLLEDKDVLLVDLPGIYSLSHNSLDEAIATQALLGSIKGEARPDILIAVIDATNLERNLYLTSQLIDLGLPLLVVLNMSDLAEKQGIIIRRELLARALDVPVVALVASKAQGMSELRNELTALLASKRQSTKAFGWLDSASPFRRAAEELGIKHAASHHGSTPALFIGSALLSDATSAASEPLQSEVIKARQELLGAGIDCVSFEATQRYTWINSIVKGCCAFEPARGGKLTAAIDRVITHRVWGTLVFFALMAFIFQSIFMWASIPMEFIDNAVAAFGNYVSSFMSPGMLRSLIVDGIIAGVGSVLIFVPQIAILFFFLGLLEDSGYLSRAAFLMDRVMRQFGLQGRSFIPLLSSFACAIPGILSTRTIPSFSDRLATILIAPLMSCSARLPVYTLLIAAFVPSTYVFGIFSLQGLVLFAMYVLGIVGAALVAWILKFTILRGEPAVFVMEMPPFRLPSLLLALREVFDRIVLFLKSAGTVILACSVILWFLASYPQGEVKQTLAGQIGTAMEPIIAPLGFNWEIGVGLLASFAAREVFISSLSTVYHLQEQDTASQSLLNVLKEKQIDGSFTLSTALSLMVFYVFACQCMSTLAVCRRETGSWGWTAFMFSYMTILAYGASYFTYHAANYYLK